DGIDVPAGDASLVVARDDALLLALDDGGLEALGPGAHPLVVRGAGLVSRRAVLRVAAAGAPAVDAPEVPHDPDDDLVLSGASLGGAEEAVLWPDVGVAAPTDVRSVPVGDVTADAVTVPAAGGLATLPAGRGPWRLTVR